jgi:hypothetical protein
MPVLPANVSWIRGINSDVALNHPDAPNKLWPRELIFIVTLSPTDGESGARS